MPSNSKGYSNYLPTNPNDEGGIKEKKRKLLKIDK